MIILECCGIVYDWMATLPGLISVIILSLTLKHQIDSSSVQELKDIQAEIFRVASAIHFKSCDNNREYGFFDLSILHKNKGEEESIINARGTRLSFPQSLCCTAS